jgi:hypothetical protein
MRCVSTGFLWIWAARRLAAQTTSDALATLEGPSQRERIDMEEQAQERAVPTGEQAEYRGVVSDFALGVATGLAIDGVKDGVKVVGKHVVDAVKPKDPPKK